MLSFIIVNYETADLCTQCINSIKNNKSINDSKLLFEIIIIDNDSSEHDKKKLDLIEKNYKELNIKIQYLDNNYGFGYANNRGAEIAEGEVLCLLNSDTILTETNIYELYKLACQDESGFVSCYILNGDLSFQSAGFDFPTLKNDLKQSITFSNFNFRKKKIKLKYEDDFVEKDWLSGAFLFVEKEFYKSIKGFDENIFMYSEDIDICFQSKKAKKKNYLLKSTYIIHDQKKAYYSRGLFRKIWVRKKNYFYVLKKNTDISNLKLILIKLCWFLNTMAIVIYKKITYRRV